MPRRPFDDDAHKPDPRFGWALERTELARERNILAKERNALAKDRVHLANKRTFLAWCRTCLTIMSFGFILEKVVIFLLQEHLEPEMLVKFKYLGIASFIIGPCLLIFAGWRYLSLQRRLGLRKTDYFVIPEVILFSLILGFALFYTFL